MNVKVDMGNGRVFTCEQLASALTLVIENMILKPKVTQDRFLITLEYKYHKDGQTSWSYQGDFLWVYPESDVLLAERALNECD